MPLAPRRFRSIFTALCLCALACKPSPSPSQPASLAQPDPDQDAKDLDAFFRGELIVSNAGAPDEPTWPLEDQRNILWWPLSVFTQPKYGWGIKDAAGLKEALSGPVSDWGIRQEGLLRWLDDYPAREDLWRHQLDAGDDPRAAYLLSYWLSMTQGPKQGLEQLARAHVELDPSADLQTRSFVGQIFGWRCELQLRLHQLREAERSCDNAMTADQVSGRRTMIKVLLAEGRTQEALTMARGLLKTPGRDRPQDFLTLGLAERSAGLTQAALGTWSVALQRWPKNRLLTHAIEKPGRNVFEVEEDESEEHRFALARDLARCGIYETELGFPARAEACFAASRAIAPEPAMAAQIILKGESSIPAALEEAKKDVTLASTSPDLLTAMSWALVRSGKSLEADPWVNRALDLEPSFVQAMQLKWNVCGEQKDYLCVIDYRRRLGLPTHFNQQQYRDAKKAFEEQARRTGAGLAAAEPPTKAGEGGSKVRRQFTIVPLGEEVPAELQDIVPDLQRRLPGLSITLAAPEPIPLSSYSAAHSQLIWENLLGDLPPDSGRVYVLEEDLGNLRPNGSFSFAKVDLPSQRAAVSLARLRSLAGGPDHWFAILSGGSLAVARHRLETLLVSTLARLDGLDFPCSDPTCALHEKRSVHELGDGSDALCPRHKEMLQTVIGKAAVAPPVAP